MALYKTEKTKLVVAPNPNYPTFLVIDEATHTEVTAFQYEVAARIYAATCPSCPTCNRILVGAYDTKDHRAGLAKYQSCYGH